MARKMLGKPIYTADNVASSPTVYQRVEFNTNIQLLAARVVLIQYNNPTYTSVQLKIFANRDGSPGKLLYTSSNAVTKATIAPVQSHSFADIYFQFSTKPQLRKDDYYFFALYINGAYAGDATTHLAWKTGWPDPVFKTGITQTQAKAAKYPLEINFITAEVK